MDIKEMFLSNGNVEASKYLFSVMEDGTIEYTPTWELKLDSTNNGFKSYA